MRLLGPTRWLALPAAATALAAGCSAYVVRGQVVPGPISDLTFVGSDDPRLEDQGLANVRVTVQRDPGKLAARRVGRGLSDAWGRFAIPLDATGAGWTHEQWLIEAWRSGYKLASGRVRLSRDEDRLLLIILAPGFSPDPEEEDLLQQYERFR